jgi:valyl-tRNA synthetase
MAGADSVEIAATVERSQDAATAVVHDVECHVLGVVDLDQEKKKLEKKRDGLAKRVEGSKRKLGNEGFVAKAPPAVVEQEKARLADMEQQLQKLEARLREL